jgi:small-conductance mechanosensitive channel
MKVLSKKYFKNLEKLMNAKKSLLLLSIISSTLLFGEATPSDQNDNSEIIKSSVLQKSRADLADIKRLLVEKEHIEKELIDDNIWSKIYSNYHTYKVLKRQKRTLNAQIVLLEGSNLLTPEQEEILEVRKAERTTLLGKLELLKEYEKDPFKKFLTPPVINVVPTVTNPFAVISALSYFEKLNSDQEEYNSYYESLQHIVDKLKERQTLILKLQNLDKVNPEYTKGAEDIKDQIAAFIPVLEIFKTTNNVYSKKIDEIKLNLQHDIKKEMGKTVTIGAIVLFFVFLLFFIKYLVRKYMSDNERYYTINKALNISFVTVLIFTLLLAYIENVSYLVTILGFASAGIAIAMKDWFMSLMGWATIVIGGAIHVGDRVRFVREGVEYVGDIVDISMLRMTMHEDINLTSYLTNRRAGRMIFIPNNFIFTDMIANYSHAGLKTVWDGIDFVITFDSDANKASQIAKEITKKYSKGYTEITRKQLNKLRSKYGMRNTNVEPRIFTHIEPYGLKISAWYLTNSYATMTLRSTISIEIISRIQAEDSIQLAFPTQSIYVDKNVPRSEIKPDEINPNKEL